MLRILGLSTVRLLVFFVLGLALSGGSARAEHADEQGTLIPIGPDQVGRARRGRLEQPGFQETQEVISRYWIGIAGGPIPPQLRAHLRIDASEGVMVHAVEEKSPAEEGGLKKYDVIVRVNGDPIGNTRQLADVVGDQGEMRGQLTVEIIRHGESDTVYVTPVKRPVGRQMAPRPRRNRTFFGGEVPFRGRLLNQEPLGWGQLPNGVSISITREGNLPAKITVRRGEETWEIDMGDPDSLAQLPEELRPLLEQATGEGPAVGFLKEMLEGGGLGIPFGFGQGGPLHGANDAELQRRLLEMEQQMEDLRRRFGVPNEAPAFEPQNEGEPESLPKKEGPTELEIPAES